MTTTTITTVTPSATAGELWRAYEQAKERRNAEIASLQTERDQQLTVLHGKHRAEMDALEMAQKPEWDAIFEQLKPEWDAVFAKFQTLSMDRERSLSMCQPEYGVLVAKRTELHQGLHAQIKPEWDALSDRHSAEREKVYADWDLKIDAARKNTESKDALDQWMFHLINWWKSENVLSVIMGEAYDFSG